METIDLGLLAVATSAGLAAGAVFFGGLYLTTRRLSAARRPMLLTITSLATRSALVLVGAWWIGTRLGLPAILGYLVGVTAARVALVIWVKRGEVVERA